MTQQNHDVPETDAFDPAASSLAGQVNDSVMAE
ncbi:chorismate mutase, partial [Arthrobacter sp. HMWF013]